MKANRKRKFQKSAAGNADDLEMEAIRKQFAVAEEGLTDERLAQSLQDDYGISVPGEASDWALRELSVETAVTAETKEIQRRASTLGDAYPFRLTAGGIAYRGNKTLAYEFCLCLTRAESLSEGKYAQLPPAFERLTGLVLARSLGFDNDWYRLGWPPDAGRPATLREMIDHLHARTGEWHWGNLPELSTNPLPSSEKDGGIDIVVWKHFGDSRQGKVFLLGQCACGNNWPSKLGDLDPKAFEGKWLKKLSYTGEQLRFMAIPFHIPDKDVWIDGCTRAGILLDRIRITSLAERTGADQVQALQDLIPLIRLVIPEFQPLQAPS